MFERNLTRFACWLVVAVGLGLPGSLSGQERAKVAISFLPPPMETATYSLGIYDARSRKLVRRLHEFAPGSAFTTGLNGLITSWDGKDDDGKGVPPGRYAALGYAVGELKVDGKAVLGNDWAGDNEALRISSVQAILLVPEDDGLAIAGTTPLLSEQVARYGGDKTELLWQKFTRPVAKPGAAPPRMLLEMHDGALVTFSGADRHAYSLATGEIVASGANAGTDKSTVSIGKDSTVWKIEEGVLAQYSAGGERLRSLAPKEGEPLPIAVTASKSADRLFLLEQSKDMQRVRGLSWKENSQEGDKAVSTWTTFFENVIRPGFVPVGPNNAALSTQAEISLVENPLSPGKPERLKISAAFDAKGSYLATADGLRLRQISQRQNLNAVKLAKSKVGNALSFYQGDRAAWDEFSIEGAREMMSFDAGEIDLTATGEKKPEKATEPDL